MKKLIYPLFALAALAMTTSCSDELENKALDSNETIARFTVKLDEASGARAIGDGTTAKNLYFAVYKAGDGVIGDEVEALRQRVDVQPDLTATINTRLVKGQTYNFVFWAQAEKMEVAQTFNGDGAYYNIKDMSCIKVKYNTPANNEERDAFYARENNLKITGPINKTITLKRPFAQVNVGTLIGSLAEAATADVIIAKSKITFSEVATEFHPYDGTVGFGEETEAQEVTFSANFIPESVKDDNEGDLKEVAGEDYEYLSMNYILVADQSTDGTNPENGEGSYVIPNTTFEIFNDAGTSINSFEIPNITVQRNWRTNIIGDILNSSVTFEIVIDPVFDKDNNDDDHNYFTEKELLFAAASGGEVTLTEDVTLESTLEVKAGNSMVLNLNGKTITNKVGNQTTDVIVVEEDATLTINGNGNITAVTGNDGYAVISDGTLIINGGTFTAGEDADGVANAVIYARGKGKVYVNGGTFPNDANSGFVLNKKDADRATTEIVVKGGTFTNFDPANNAAEGTGTNFVAEGYESVKDPNANIWYVVKKGVEVATTATELTNALASTTAKEVAMTQDVEVASTVTISEGATLDGKGNTVTMTKNNTQSMIAPAKGGIIKNINITGYNTRNDDGKVIRGILETDIAGDLVLDNVNISGVAYPMNIQANKNFVPTSSLTVTGSTLVGWTSYTGLTSASFTDCAFKVGNYFDTTVAGQESWNGCLKPYVTSTFTRCEFAKGFVLDLSKLKADATLTFKNCTVGGTPLTADNYATLLGCEENTAINF